MNIPVEHTSDKLCIYNVVPTTNTEKAIQEIKLKNNTEQ